MVREVVGGGTEHPPLSRGVIALMLVATAGSGIATLVPMAFTLALKLDQIAPGREGLLGFILGATALSSLLTAPLTGILSDRTRTRWGRRHPYTVGGLAVGMSATTLLILADDVVALGVGWILVSLGFGTAMGSIGNFQADRLPRQQRGKVAGLAGLTMQVSPVVGILLAGAVANDVVWVFLLPSLVGVLLMSAFVFFVHEEDNRGEPRAASLSIATVVRSYGFRPRAVPDFAWNWLGRFVFHFGLALTTSFGAFFYSQRLELPVSDVVTVLAITSSMSIVTAFVGSLGAGWLSDRTGRRRPFILGAAVLVGTGFSLSAFAWSLPLVLAGAFVSSLGIAVFLSVNQAITLDVLPHPDTQAGRYTALSGFAQKIPSALAPLLAPVILMIGGVSGTSNYTALYLAAAACVLAGGCIVMLKVQGVR